MPFTQGHALVIGVGSYQHHQSMNVPVATTDATEVGNVLRDPAFCGYPKNQIKALCEAAAIRRNILASLDAIAIGPTERDTVFLFFCGHGSYGDDGYYYLTTHDTRVKNGKVVSGSGLCESELIEKLRAIKAKRLLFVVNACHSGGLAPTLGHDELPGVPLPMQTAVALLSTGEGRIIITACRENQFSYIGDGPLTLFTQALVDGLRGHGTSSTRGYLSAFDLYTHLYFTVEETVRQKYGATQEPELTVIKGVGPFAVSLYRGATTLGEFHGAAHPPPGMAVREINPVYAQTLLANYVGRYQATVAGTGAIAQGGGDALGERSVKVGSHSSSGNIVTGNTTVSHTSDESEC
jgi:hypothetical protein